MIPSRTNTQKGSGPLYLSIAASLRRDISNGVLSPGERLPSIAELAVQHQVSVITIRQTLELLESERLIERHQGRGTFVSDHAGIGMTLTLKSDWKTLLEHLEGKKPKLVTVADKVATPLLDPQFGKLEPAYRYMRRVHSFSDTPYALIDIYLSQRVFDLDPEGFTKGMVISRLAELPEAHVGRLQQRVSFTTADPQTSELLNVPQNSAIGDVLRVITDSKGRAIYVGKTKYRGDFVKLEFDTAGQEL
ncbi:MAG: GntR family transcriptional regulator [Roseovarius sp.]